MFRFLTALQKHMTDSDTALVTASDDKFTYAAVFCAVAALMGTLITIGPRIMDQVNTRLASGREQSIKTAA